MAPGQGNGRYIKKRSPATGRLLMCITSCKALCLPHLFQSLRSMKNIFLAIVVAICCLSCKKSPEPGTTTSPSYRDKIKDAQKRILRIFIRSFITGLGYYKFLVNITLAKGVVLPFSSPSIIHCQLSESLL